ncbi:hypothetical protein EYZ11_013457 [Aspergillus tanneri]|nr:hypothetical protein EYZ11_013457 [Aspergillus tanneri]
MDEIELAAEQVLERIERNTQLNVDSHVLGFYRSVEEIARQGVQLYCTNSKRDFPYPPPPSA